MNTLKGIADIKAYFKENKTPIYFISATNFNLLGIDEWISNFKFRMQFINYITYRLNIIYIRAEQALIFSAKISTLIIISDA